MSQAPTTSVTSISSIVPLPTPIADFFSGLTVRIKEYTKEAVEHLILTVLIYCVLCVLLYVGIVRWRVLEFRRDVRNPKRVLLVIAHPDDECMFFGPTVLNFTGNKNCTLYIMCLSTGNQVKIYLLLYIVKVEGISYIKWKFCSNYVHGGGWY